MGWAIAAVVTTTLVLGAVLWLVRAMRRVAVSGVRGYELDGRSPEQVREQIARILEVNRAAEAELTQIVPPGLAVFPAPTWRSDGDRTQRALTLLPDVFRRAYYSPEACARLDTPESRALLLDLALAVQASPPLGISHLQEVIDIYEGDVGDAPTVREEVEYQPGDRPLSLLIADVARMLAVGATAEQLRAHWGLSGDEAAKAEMEGVLDRLLRADADAFSQALDGPGVGGDALILPRFLTPGRRARHAQLIEQVSEETASATVEIPEPLTVEVAGLPYPIDFVVDLGSHVTPLHEPVIDGKTVSMAALRMLAVENLREGGDPPLLPDGELVSLRDPGDHGAVCALLVPDLLGDDENVLVVAPSHATLILFREDDPEQVSTARSLFEQWRAEGDGDAPMPEPVRVTPRGFEATSWKRCLDA